MEVGAWCASLKETWKHVNVVKLMEALDDTEMGSWTRFTSSRELVN